MSTDSRLRQFGSKTAGPGHPVYVVGEIGINHNGELENAFKLIDAAAEAGCDAVKFQKRTPEICTPRDQWDIERDTPWGRMTYIDYRHRVEFGLDEYAAIDEHAKRRGIDWFAHGDGCKKHETQHEQEDRSSGYADQPSFARPHHSLPCNTFSSATEL